MDKTPGKLLGKGMTAEVLEWEEGRVVKLYKEGADRGWAEYERWVTGAVQQSGAPAPAIYGIMEHQQRFGVIMERIDGVPLSREMIAHLERGVEIAREMAELHAAIHRCQAPDLPRQEKRLEEGIHASEGLLMGKLGPVLEYLRTLTISGEGSSVSICHGDLHPDNIVRTAAGLKAIDWMNAHAGNPAGDAARTSLMFLSPYLPAEVPGATTEMIMSYKIQLNEAYIQRYCELMGVGREAIERWMVPVAAERLRENVPGEREWLLTMIEEGMLT
ncbi:phosphotransferase family protein [Paenibacillus sp. NEAU-GSW1]|uniref:phosphotransferase family protein n=1 Tax=Paenibacillus sp. NEAU-GSW1 TaxID=2682486 RepID=UPI0012E323DC|nr:phosphotransferase [Paenibacillus sp. NEAU-GSW1]MUT66119.1 phosphotransferase [Paenibacillus sp. NEAU-GSW1]